MNYVIMHANSPILYGIMDKERYKAFKEERNMDLFQVFKLNDSELDVFIEDQNLINYETETYFFKSEDDGESGSVVISCEEETMYFENYGIHLMDYTDSFRRMYKLIASNVLKLSQEEYDTVLRYLSKLYVHTIDEESPQYKEMDDEGMSLFNDSKLIIDSVLTSYGFLRRADDED